MSICTTDIFATHKPKLGIIKPSVEATLTVSCSVPILGMPTADPFEQMEFAQRKVIARLYADIAQDFEEFLQAITVAQPFNARALELRDRIRVKLAGDGHGEKAHKAPPVPPAKPA